jgi:hypothetical protein
VSRYPSVPDFIGTADSLEPAVRAMKDTIEQLAGQRQGQSLGAPVVFVQPLEPSVPPLLLKRGDQWINDQTHTMAYWTGQRWQALA